MKSIFGVEVACLPPSKTHSGCSYVLVGFVGVLPTQDLKSK